jgi:hypothetical protein
MINKIKDSAGTLQIPIYTPATPWKEHFSYSQFHCKLERQPLGKKAEKQK